MADDADRIRILVLDRGFVLVGYCPDPAGHLLWLTLTNCRAIRRWGTTQGLAELRSGPTPSTQMDAVMPRELISGRVIIRVLDDLEQDAWRPHLTPPSSSAATPPSRSSRTGSRSTT
jgi:hypothetical protein